MFKRGFSKFFFRFAVALSLSLLPRIAAACSYAIDPNNPDFDPNADRNYYGQYFFLAVWILLVSNIGFASLTLKKYVWGIFVFILAVPAQLALLVFSMLMNSCGDSYHLLIRVESLILFLILGIQLAAYVYRRRLNLE